MLLFVLLSAAVIALKEAPSLIREKHWKDFCVFCGFLLTGIVLGIVLVFRLPFPNLTKGIEAVFKPVTELLFEEG